MDPRLPAVYIKAIEAYSDWEISLPNLGQRTWYLASAGPNNPLTLQTQLIIDGNCVAFIDQMRVWVENANRSARGNRTEIDCWFAKSLAIGESNGDLLLVAPDGNSMYVFHHDGACVEKLPYSIEDFASVLSGHTQRASKSSGIGSGPEGLIGRWRNLDDSLGEEILSLAADGAAMRQYDDGSALVGTWSFRNDTLCFNIGEPNCPPDQTTYEIESISPSRMSLFDRENDFREHFERCG